MSDDGNEIYNKRDMMLGEIHERTRSTNEKIDKVLDWCETHKIEDDQRYKDTNKHLIYGALAILVVAFASGVLPQLLNHIKIGV